ncbi:hypothetical protein TSAR_007185 [Trichomalopsis sarcophagae]|uniref:Uncharacterized protein n=1 Tax=Trichomalopsis sarcophagae TaxID=543379 RepID=A0A232FJ62_9HYME|nr:hypothetical protein TSAR_007185 [Trichomalopsis sarcophagae]
MSLFSVKLQETTLILSILGTRYIGERCRHDIRVLQPRKLPSHKFRLIFVFSDPKKTPSNEFLVAMLQFSVKLSETTLILPTLGTRYLGERCRRYIRVHQPRKPSSNKFRLIMFQILTKLQETTLILSTLGTRMHHYLKFQSNRQCGFIVVVNTFESVPLGSQKKIVTSYINLAHTIIVGPSHVQINTIQYRKER